MSPDGVAAAPDAAPPPGVASRVVDGVLAVTVAACALATLGQVVMRYVFAAPVSWAEEVAMLLFAWMVFIGAARAQRGDTHLSIDLLRRVLPARGARALDAFRLLLIGGCSLVLIFQGVRLAARTAPLEYPATGLSRAFLYGSVPVCFAVGLVYVVLRLRRLRSPGAV